MMTTEDTITDQTITDADKYAITFVLSGKYLAAKNVPSGIDRNVGVMAARPMRPYSRLICTISLFFHVNLRFGFFGALFFLLDVNLLISIIKKELT